MFWGLSVPLSVRVCVCAYSAPAPGGSSSRTLPKAAAQSFCAQSPGKDRIWCTVLCISSLCIFSPCIFPFCKPGAEAGEPVGTGEPVQRGGCVPSWVSWLHSCKEKALRVKPSFLGALGWSCRAGAGPTLEPGLCRGSWLCADPEENPSLVPAQLSPSEMSCSCRNLSLFRDLSGGDFFLSQDPVDSGPVPPPHAMNYRGNLERRNPSPRSLSSFPPHPLFSHLSKSPVQPKHGARAMRGAGGWICTPGCRPSRAAMTWFPPPLLHSRARGGTSTAFTAGDTGEAMQVAEQPSDRARGADVPGWLRGEGTGMSHEGGDSWPQNPLAKAVRSTVPPIPERAEPLGCVQCPPERQSPLSPGRQVGEHGVRALG